MFNRMKNKLLFTTALIAVFSASQALALEQTNVKSGEKKEISGEVFSGYESDSAKGVLHNQGTTVIADAEFLNNKITSQNGAAISNNRGELSVSNTTFDGNTAKDGGAVYNGNGGNISEISGIFTNNTASNRGGALYNSGTGTVSNIQGTFRANRADKGGAIANAGTSATGKITITDSTFIGNEAVTAGGAIHNMKEGELSFSGDNVFSENTANGQLNDIYNNGSITVEEGGHLTLDGGISQAEGETGSITFKEGTRLTVNAGITTIANDVYNEGASLDMVFANGFNGQEGYQLVSGNLDNEFSITNLENGLFNIEKTDTNGTYNVVKKATEEIAAATGASLNQAATITAVTSGNTENETFNAAANQINSLLQSSDKKDIQSGIDAATVLAPEAAPIVQHTQTQTANQIFGAVGTRLSGGALSLSGEGMSSGDEALKQAAVWVQGMYNQAKLDDHSNIKGFDADSSGVAMGVEKYINDATKVGLGYAYTNTDIDGFMRDTSVDTHTALVYGEYKPSQWFVNGIASYGWSDYSENKNVAGVGIDADYDVETFGLQAMTGYEMQLNHLFVTPEAGLRYVHIKQDGYTDSADQRVSADDSDILTGVIGAKVSQSVALDKGITLKPEVKAALTYDLFNDDNNSVVTLANGSAYNIEGEALDRLGVEFGAGVTADVNENVEFSVGYEGKFREDYQDHTGLVNAKYKF